MTYIARSPASYTTSTDYTWSDDATVVLSTRSVAYDYHLNAIHKCTDTTTCKENGLVSLF